MRMLYEACTQQLLLIGMHMVHFCAMLHDTQYFSSTAKRHTLCFYGICR